MNTEFQQAALNSIANEAQKAGMAWTQAAQGYERPSVLFQPRIYKDGDHWCALYGDNLQEGVAGFGLTPDQAMRAFDKAWYSE